MISHGKGISVKRTTRTFSSSFSSLWTDEQLLKIVSLLEDSHSLSLAGNSNLTRVLSGAHTQTHTYICVHTHIHAYTRTELLIIYICK